MGFSHFKIEGRSLGSALILEFLLYYLTKPEYQLRVREESIWIICSIYSDKEKSKKRTLPDRVQRPFWQWLSFSGGARRLALFCLDRFNAEKEIHQMGRPHTG